MLLFIMWLLGLVSCYTIGAHSFTSVVIVLVLFLAGLLNGHRLA